MDILSKNLAEINSLNQRGGRMLSVVDLIEDGTLDVPVAGWLLSRVSAGDSFLCAAGPGGVGKTTLMACLLSFLPPDERIHTVTDPSVVEDRDGPTCYLCHEIGSGHWYGYLWGDDAAQFLALQRHGRIAASLHADTLEEVRQQLLGPAIGASERDLKAVDLLLFMVRERGLRRVSQILASDDSVGGFSEVAHWDRGSDSFELSDSRPNRPGPRIQAADATRLIEELLRSGTRMLPDVMRRVASLYRA